MPAASGQVTAITEGLGYLVTTTLAPLLTCLQRVTKLEQPFQARRGRVNLACGWWWLIEIHDRGKMTRTGRW